MVVCRCWFVEVAVCQLAAAEAFGLADACRRGTEGRCSISLIWLHLSTLRTAGGDALAKQHCVSAPKILDHVQLRQRLPAPEVSELVGRSMESAERFRDWFLEANVSTV